MLKGSKISRYRILKVLDCFCLDLEASKTAILLKLNRNTVNRYYKIFRCLIANKQRRDFKLLEGEIEVDESYFGPNRLKGSVGPRHRGRATNKQPVFGIYERGGRVYTEIIPDCRKKTLQKIIRGRVALASVLHTDQWVGYDGLVDVGYDRHIRIKKTSPLRKGRPHINGIEAFWSFTKRRLMKFNGVKAFFDLHLKECEWRYNKSLTQLRSELLSLCKKYIC
jgi:transposase-like protein